ncbi:MAG TPA: alpha/beta fold hydrolase [Pseudolabrys sp.]|nr:alpha/beta fold hydrolase [Pseudolabrys sp.]
MYEPTEPRLPALAFLWPAIVATSASKTASAIARQFAALALGPDGDRAANEPALATAHRTALELRAVVLRDFSTAQTGVPVLICAPFALHGAAVADLAPEHSLVAALRNAGLQKLFLADWRSAGADMQFRGIDDYLADLNVLVDQLGGRVDLIGLCQGGWLSLLYAARFRDKVRKLVIAGAPIDVRAAQSGLSTLVDASPPQLFHELVQVGEGRVLGHKVAKFWAPLTAETPEVHQLLETTAPIGSPAFARLEAKFREWFAWTLDLPGTYYLEVVEKIYRDNALARGRFVALGLTIKLRELTAPLFLLAAGEDELVAPPQLFAAARLVGTPPNQIRKETAPCRHLGLFMGRRVLNEYWPMVAHWLLAA